MAHLGIVSTKPLVQWAKAGVAVTLFRRNQELPTVTVSPIDKSFKTRRKDSILNDALAAGVPFPHSCTVGTCGSCKARLLSGKVRELIETAITLTSEELRSNYILACQSIAKTSIHLEVPGLEDMPDHPLVEVDGEIVSQRALTHDILAVDVALAQPLTYTAGQYAELRVPELSGPRAYSFARAPARSVGDGTVTFFIRQAPGGEFTEWLFLESRVGTALKLRGPFGNMWLRKGDSPILFVAGGSGLAPVKAMLEAACDAGSTRPCTVVFGARNARDLYCTEDLEELASRWGLNAEWNVVPVLSEESPQSKWDGARGLATDAVANLNPDILARCDAYVCGPPPMVDAVEELLCSMRHDTNFFHADRFLDKGFRAGGYR